jgi:sulfur carrier protein ThiS
MPAIIIYKDEQYELPAALTVQQALLIIGVDASTVLATRQGELVPDDTVIQEGETIKLVPVIAGG